MRDKAVGLVLFIAEGIAGEPATCMHGHLKEKQPSQGTLLDQ